ncbi:MAG: endonuclease [Duncaniella sp.]|nr:endonuclease [Duncaniella sp.]
MRRILSAIMLIGTSASTLTVAEVPFNGKSGEALMRAVAAASRPETTVDKNTLTFTLRDEFTGRDISVEAGQLPEGYEWDCFVPASWWGNAAPGLQRMAADDFFNLLPLDAATRAARRDLPPAVEVTMPSFADNLWSAGRTELYGVETEVYLPPASLRGELARVFMYMAAAYPAEVWTERAYMMLDGTLYPALSGYAIPILMEWHRSSPPSERECVRNDRGSGLQGNRNSFVDYPELAEYLWGDRKGEKFIVEGEAQPLRGVYTAADARVDLYSPEVPADARWSVDGRAVTATSIPVSDLAPGSHRLTYTSPSTSESGIVMIKIEK